MNERYQIAENKCLEKTIDAAFKGLEGQDSKMKQLLAKLLANTVKFAFNEGYDAGYCHAMDDVTQTVNKEEETSK